MFEKFLALLERAVVALELLANKHPTDPVANGTADPAKPDTPAKNETPRGRGGRGANRSTPANTDIPAGAGDGAAGNGAEPKGRRTRGASGGTSTKPAEETAETKALRAELEQICLNFASYADLVEWVAAQLKAKGYDNITQIKPDELQGFVDDFQQKDEDEFGAQETE